MHRVSTVAAKNRAELLSRADDLSYDQTLSSASIEAIWEMWRRRPGTGPPQSEYLQLIGTSRQATDLDQDDRATYEGRGTRKVRYC